MTLDEAIKELERGTKQSRSTNNQRLREALGLGMEALKGIKKVRKTFRPYVEALLAGETEENIVGGKG